MGWWSNEEKGRESIQKDFLEKASPYLPETFTYVVNDFRSTPWTPNHSMILGATTIASFIVGFQMGRVRPFWRPVTSIQDLSSADIGTKARWMKGTVVSVSDGDTVRFLHRPTPFTSSTTYDKDHRLALRLCTIDTPETAKFGKPGQAFGEEAKEYLKSLCLDKDVRVKILHIDQYGRGVAEVVRPGWLFNTYLDEAMLKAGMAEVYLGTGAVYGRKGKEGYLELMEKAKKKGIGIWSDSNHETAAQYKQRTKAS